MQISFANVQWNIILEWKLIFVISVMHQCIIRWVSSYLGLAQSHMFNYTPYASWDDWQSIIMHDYWYRCKQGKGKDAKEISQEEEDLPCMINKKVCRYLSFTDLPGLSIFFQKECLIFSLHQLRTRSVIRF